MTVTQHTLKNTPALMVSPLSLGLGSRDFGGLSYRKRDLENVI